MIRILLIVLTLAAGAKALSAVQSFADARAHHVARIAQEAR